MASYIVMTDPDDRNGENVRFVRDGFSLIAFLLPLVWLLWKRLWLEAALLFAAFGILGYGLHLALGDRSSEMLPLVSAALGLLCAFEGQERLVADLQRKGMRASQIIVAPSRRMAEEIFASRFEIAALPPTSSSRAFRTVTRSSLIPLTGAL
jgi:hypothetical protein